MSVKGLSEVDLTYEKPRSILKIRLEGDLKVFTPVCPNCKEQKKFYASKFLGDYNQKGYFIYYCEKCDESTIVIIETGAGKEIKPQNKREGK